MSVQLESIPTAESFSGTLNPARTLFLDPIPSAEGVSELRGVTTLSLTAIGTEESVSAIGGMSSVLAITSIPSEESFEPLFGEAGYIPPEIPITRPVRPLSLSERFSGVVLNQNVVATASVPLDYSDSGYNVYQDFFLPRDHVRGEESATPRVPPLTGFQVLVQVDLGYADVATLDWTIERYVVGDGWETLVTDTAIGTNRDGNKVWFTAYAREPIEIHPDWIGNRFRLGLRGRDHREDYHFFKEEVEYADGAVVIDSSPHEMRLHSGTPHHFLHEELHDVSGLPTPIDVPSVIHQDASTGKVYFSTERGISNVWLTHPNPLAALKDPDTNLTTAKAFDGTDTEILIEDEETSINFRILSGIAEQGTDFLGNRFRNTISSTDISSVTTLDSAAKDKFWLSKPNPSKFAVESMYFDVSGTEETPRTIDHVLVDPVTPGAYFNIYYTDEGEPGSNKTEWSDKLWNRVPFVFQMRHRFRHPLPEPITARYIKIEFTHLQPKWYAPNEFQKPILYDKHPKWVLDYFLLRAAENKMTEDPFIARQIAVDFDAYGLAYDYYVDDLRQEPLQPGELGPQTTDQLTTYLQQRSDTSDRVDLDTYNRIKLAFAPYADHPAAQATADSILSIYALGTLSSLKSGERVLRPNYSTESRNLPERTPGDFVSTLSRERIVAENSMPVMYFFLPSRHRYRQVTASLENDKAYFVGVKEIDFQRDHYTVAHDNPLYIEAAGDHVNVERSDFILNNGRWETHGS